MAAFGTKGYGTVEPNSAGYEEQISFTGITVNLSGSVSLTGVSNVGFLSPYTETSGMLKSHAGGVRFVITNSSGFYASFANKENDNTFTQTNTFDVLPVSSATPTTPTQLVTKSYADGLAIAGSPNASTTAKGIIEIATGAELAAGTGTGSTGALLVPSASSFKNTSAGAGDVNKVPVLGATGVLDQTFLGGARTWSGIQSFTAANAQITTDPSASSDAVRLSYLTAALATAGVLTGTSGEAITAGQGLYLKASDNKLYKTVGTGDESTFSFVGVANSTVAAADLSVTYMPAGGLVTGLAGLTAGRYYFISDTVGTLATTPGTRFARVAIAVSTTALLVTVPKFYAQGFVNITGTTTSVITTGFYPATIKIMAGYIGDSVSIGDGDNRCIYTYRSTTAVVDTNLDTGAAWRVYRAAGPNSGSGTVSARSATGFTLSQTFAFGGITNIAWEAESL